jgi:hypothetical protein
LSTLGNYFNFTEESTRVWQLLAMVKFKNKFGQKMGWATFWAIFSETHLLTLA